MVSWNYKVVRIILIIMNLLMFITLPNNYDLYTICSNTGLFDLSHLTEDFAVCKYIETT